MPESNYEREYAIILCRKEQTSRSFEEWCRYKSNEIDYVMSVLRGDTRGRYCVKKGNG